MKSRLWSRFYGLGHMPACRGVDPWIGVLCQPLDYPHHLFGRIFQRGHHREPAMPGLVHLLDRVWIMTEELMHRKPPRHAIRRIRYAAVTLERKRKRPLPHVKSFRRESAPDLVILIAEHE